MADMSCPRCGNHTIYADAAVYWHSTGPARGDGYWKFEGVEQAPYTCSECSYESDDETEFYPLEYDEKRQAVLIEAHARAVVDAMSLDALRSDVQETIESTLEDMPWRDALAEIQESEHTLELGDQPADEEDKPE